MKNLHFLQFCLFFLTGILTAQEVKNEQEKRIDQDELPQEVMQQLEQMPVKLDKAKFYLQKNTDSKRYEIKVRHNNRKHSIEFQMEGALRNIEIEIAEEELPEDVQERIAQYLKNTFERHKIEKVQLHFDAAHLEAAFEGGENPDFYELVVATKNKKNKLEKKEISFDPQGNHVKTRKIIRQSYDFLLF